MRILLCNKCQERKQEIEFEYHYFQKQYSHVCKQCESQTKSRVKDPGTSGEDLVRDKH